MTKDGNGMKEIVPGIFQKNEVTFYIRCRIAGTLHYCCKERLDKLANKYGSIAHVGSQYESRDAKRLMKAKTPVKTIQKMDPKELKEEAQAIKHHKEKKKEERTEKRELKERIRVDMRHRRASPGTVHGYELFSGGKECLRPNLFIYNLGYCNGCGWFECCTYKDKMEREFEDQPERIEEINKLTTRVDVFTPEESERDLLNSKKVVAVTSKT